MTATFTAEERDQLRQALNIRCAAGVPTPSDLEFRARAELTKGLPAGFGDGWMSVNARDAVRVALFAGFEPRELVLRIVKRSHPGRRVNERTVLRVMSEMESEGDQ